jgi:hypothetical protein
MILLRTKKYSFRERFPEWVLSLGLIVWGVSVINQPDLFNSHSTYQPLLDIMSQSFWAWLTIGIGAFRLSVLAINGAWRPTAHFRAIGAAGGVTVWASLTIISILSLPERAPAIGTYGMLLAFDLMALWWAAGDAKIVDQLAKREQDVSDGQ